eukprot:jgi/Galph1/5314/GphlegSOOS_G3967.1
MVAAVALLISFRNKKRPRDSSSSASSSHYSNVSEPFKKSFSNPFIETDSTTKIGQRKWGRVLQGVGRVTIGTDLEHSFLFQKQYLSEQETIQVDSEELSGLIQLATSVELFLIIRVKTDEDEENVRKALQVSGLFSMGLNPAKVLFCETLQGTVATVRQMEPQLHIDSDAKVLSELERFIHRLVYIGSGALSCQHFGNKPIAMLEKLSQIFQ